MIAPTIVSVVSNLPLDEFKVSFELKSDSIWQAPNQGQETDVYLALEMTNLGDKPIRFPIMDKFKVSMQHPDGNELMMEGGQDVLIPGSIWWIGPLEAGSYQLNMYYENETETNNNNNSDLWSGNAKITPIMILITN